MERIKSALEIAMEKAERLGKASAEELRQMKEAEYASLGEAIAKRYLRGESGTKQLEAELKKLQDGRDLVLKAVIEEILGSLRPEDPDRAIEAVTVLTADKKGAKEAVEELKSLCHEHASRRERIYAELKAKLEQPIRQELSKLGISGSAIQIDLESNPQWLQTKEEMDSEFQLRLSEIKRRLLS
jgi:hypothetical protein